MQVRRAALHLLLTWEAEDGYINLMLDPSRMAAFSPQDRAFLTALLYGTVERKLTLDYVIGTLAARPASALTPHTRALLRLGLYQLLYMTQVPPFAAVHETVALAENPGEASLVNALLRTWQRKADTFPWPSRAKNLARHLSVRYSMPLSLVRYFLQRLGDEEAEELLAALQDRPPLTLRVNTLRCGRDALLAALRAQGYDALPAPLARDAILLRGDALPTALPGFAEGCFHVQDQASQLAVEALSPTPGSYLLDVCACPGGKTFTAAQYMRDRGRIEAFDLHESKLSLLQSGADRLGITILRTARRDAACADDARRSAADYVLCDVPCSGWGVLAKKPDLRWRAADGERTALPALQSRILSASAACLRPGGVMLYSTCTLRREENEALVAQFLAGHPDFALTPFTVAGMDVPEGMLTLWPHRHGTDGFFFARLQKCN